ncbi:TetR/AcrR family transcriptional regulator [Rhodococcus sp. PAMC28707]|nr:TetR/AcrR family transcriptional regulator [Rhodococcus sp. PAMC28705]QCB60875.1 TetR/AcrR family transcriptional regulator [Rhodococcus sp. PAMC28707]
MVKARAPRNSLTRERVVACAVTLADRDGVPALTMRALADELGVRPMAIYNHVANKEDILDAIVDHVFGEVYLPVADGVWSEELARRSRSLRLALGRHPWATALMETRVSPGEATLTNHEAVLDVLLSNGFSLSAAAHTYAVVDAFVYGFALQESMLASIDIPSSAQAIRDAMDLTKFPRMAQFAGEHVMQPGYSFADSFEVGLAMVIDGAGALRLPSNEHR